MNRQIINIVNFIRAVEPREYVDLLRPVKEQIKLMKKHSLKGTFLLQYDALILDEYVELLKDLDPEQFELGVWYEVVQPLVEGCGLVWRGRFPWDWHTHCGFPVGYSKPEREKLIDLLYQRFKAVFGYYPRVFGSWLFDTHTARYVADKYGADAFCNCKEQYGTDGYTLWGGYYGQGYYPSRKNVFLPAADPENQISVPLFRMLGSDQVYQYDYRIDPDRTEPVMQEVISLEPAYHDRGGGCKRWVDWYLKENFNGECLSFGYAQAGQENSFGWDRMKDGLAYQFAEFERLQNEGRLTVETLGETGRWYKSTYPQTPPSAITAHSAYDSDKTSVWYSSRYYRVNLYTDQSAFRIRDLHIFSDNCPDIYEDTVCTENCAVYEALPVIDGNRYTGKGVLAGGYIDGVSADGMVFTDNGDGSARVSYGSLEVVLSEKGLRITAPSPFTLENRIGIGGDHLPEVTSRTESELCLRYRGTPYRIKAVLGRFADDGRVMSDGNVLELSFEG